MNSKSSYHFKPIDLLSSRAFRTVWVFWIFCSSNFELFVSSGPFKPSWPFSPFDLYACFKPFEPSESTEPSEIYLFFNLITLMNHQFFVTSPLVLKIKQLSQFNLVGSSFSFRNRRCWRICIAFSKFTFRFKRVVRTHFVSSVLLPTFKSFHFILSPFELTSANVQNKEKR